VVDPSDLRMLLFGMALVLVMIFRPEGIWPSPRRARRAAARQPGHGAPGAGESLRCPPLRRPLLEARGVGKQFGGLAALADVSLAVRRGEIYGLIGPNGAGKTTLFNCLTGLYQPTAGGFRLDGQSLSGLKPHAVARRGIARTFQNIRLFANMTALENAMVGRHARTRAGVLGAVLRKPRHACRGGGHRRHAERLLAYVGIAHRAGDLAKHLSYGDQRRSRSRARWRPSRSCSRSTSPPPA